MYDLNKEEEMNIAQELYHEAENEREHGIQSDGSDDKDMCKRTRSMYALGNMLTRNFSGCNIDVKVALFKTYCSGLYCCALWSRYKVATWKRVKVCHNDIFRKLLLVPRYHSASQLFVNNRVNNLDAISRTCMYSLQQRLKYSQNRLVVAVCLSEMRVYSRTWQHFNVKLRGHDNSYYI